MLIQQINLYPKKNKDVKFNLSLKKMSQITVIVIVILSTITVYDIANNLIQYFSLKSAQNVKTETQKKQILAEELYSKSDQELLAKAILIMEDNIVGYQNLLNALKSLEQYNDKDFSLYLNVFSQESIPGLWLTKFNILQGGQSVALEGNSLAAANITKLAQQLGNQGIFKNKQFKLFKMEANEEKTYLKFSLKTDDKDVVSTQTEK